MSTVPVTSQYSVPRNAPKAIQREEIETTVMEPMLNGGYHERTYAAHAWQCPSCGLVWDKKWYAESCATRNHAPSFQQRYGVRGTLNGKPYGNIYYVTRQSLRRDPIK